MKAPTKRQILVLGASSALGVALLGGAALAQVGTPTGPANVVASLPAPMQATAAHFGVGGTLIDAALEYIGITREQLRTEFEAGKTLAEIAVENGKTREGLVAAMVAAGQTELETRVEKLVDAERPFPGHPGAKLLFGDLTDAAVTYLGVTRGELMTELRDGNSLAEVAEANGLSRDGLVAAMTEAGNAAIDEAEAAGRITADQAATARENLAERIETIVDAEKPFGPPFGRDGRGAPGRWR